MTPFKPLLAALAVAVALAVTAGEARASFTYQVTATPTSVTFGTGSTYAITPAFNGAASPTLAGSQTINLTQNTQTSTTATGTDGTTIPLSLTVTITNLNGGGAGSFTVNGSIVITRSDTQGAASTYTMTSIMPASLTLGNFVYTLATPSYSAPTIQGGVSAQGALSILITEAAVPVPEPSSLVLAGVGGVLLGALGLRRHRRAA